MKDTRFNKAIKDIKNISMTSAEKQVVLERVMKISPIKSPWTVYSFGKWIQTHRPISALVVIVIVISAGNSAVLASRNTLPGDTLYPIKVNMVEPIRVAFAPTPTIKAEIQTELVQSRLQEAETLAARGQLNTTKEKDINQRIDQQVSDLTANIDNVKKSSPEKADDISTTLEASINTHERILDAIAINQGESRHGKENGTTGSAAVTTATATMVAPTLTSESTQTQTQAPETSPKLNKKSESKDDSNKNKKYSKRKESVESLIQSTTADVASATTTATSSLLQETIVNDARINLDRAQEKLQEAQNHNSNGNTNEAYSALIDSERATKEAVLFIKATSRLEKEVKNEEMKASSQGNSNVQGGQSGKTE